MRADRLLSILIELQVRGIANAETLATRFAVSRRTIYRDVDVLESIGIPVYAEHGPGGGFRLVDGYRTRLTGLSHPEIEALMLVGLAAPAADLGLAEHAASARLKLLAALPPGSTDAALRVGERFHLDPVDWYRRTTPPPLLPAISRSVWDGTRLSIDYESWKTRRRSIVDPLGLVMKSGVWYLVAASKSRPNIYRVDGVRALEALAEPVARPRHFDLVAFWSAEVARFEQDCEGSGRRSGSRHRRCPGSTSSVRTSPSRSVPRRPMRAAVASRASPSKGSTMRPGGSWRSRIGSKS